MDEERRLLIRSTVGTAIVGVLVGLVLVGAYEWLSPVTNARSTFGDSFRIRSFVLFLVIAAAVLGTALGWVAERLSGCCGEILLIPISAGVVVAGGVAYGGVYWLFDFRTLPRAMVIGSMAAAVWAGAALRVTSERWR